MYPENISTYIEEGVLFDVVSNSHYVNASRELSGVASLLARDYQRFQMTSTKDAFPVILKN